MPRKLQDNTSGYYKCSIPARVIHTAFHSANASITVDATHSFGNPAVGVILPTIVIRVVCPVGAVGAVKVVKGAHARSCPVDVDVKP